MTEGRHPVEIGEVGYPLLVPDPQNKPNVYAIRERHVPIAPDGGTAEEQVYEYPGGWGGMGHRRRLQSGPFYNMTRNVDLRHGPLIMTGPWHEPLSAANRDGTYGVFEQGGYRFIIGRTGYNKFLGGDWLGATLFPYDVRGAVLYDGKIHVGGVPGVDPMRRLDTVAAGAPSSDTWGASATFNYTPLCVEPERLWVQSSPGGIRSLPYGQDAITGGLYSGEFEIDDPTIRINSAISLGGQLVVGKEDGMYSFDEALVVRALTPKFRTLRSGSNFKQLVEHDGAVWGVSILGPVRYAPGEADEGFVYNVLSGDSGLGRCAGVASCGREIYLSYDARVPFPDDAGDLWAPANQIIALREPDQGDRSFLPYVPHTVATGMADGSLIDSVIRWELDDYDNFAWATVAFNKSAGGRPRVYETDFDYGTAVSTRSVDIGVGPAESGEDRYAVAFVLIGHSAALPTVSAMTFNGLAMTQLTTQDSGADRRLITYYYRNPDEGQHVMSLTLSGAADDVALLGFGVGRVGIAGPGTDLQGQTASATAAAQVTAPTSAATNGLNDLILGAILGHDFPRMVDGKEEVVRFQRGTFAASGVAGASESHRLFPFDSRRLLVTAADGTMHGLSLPGPDGTPFSAQLYVWDAHSGSTERSQAYLGETDCGHPDQRKLFSRLTIARVLRADAERNLVVSLGLNPREEPVVWRDIRSEAGVAAITAAGEGVELSSYDADPPEPPYPRIIEEWDFYSIDVRLAIQNGGSGNEQDYNGRADPFLASFPIRLYYYLAGKWRRVFDFTVFWDAALHDELSVLEMHASLRNQIGYPNLFRAEGFTRGIENCVVNAVSEVRLVTRSDPNQSLEQAGYAFDVVVSLWTPEI